MRRLVPFVVILGIITYLAWWACKQLRFTLDRASFVVGIGVAALTGLAWFTVDGWWSTATRPYRPQTVTLTTKETPSQIGCASFWATVRLFVFAVVVIFLIIWIVRSIWI
jgi:hypothetical protein